MNYTEFVSRLQRKLQESLGDSVNIEFRQIIKNNEVSKDSFLISEKGRAVSPAVYLEEYYQACQCGLTIQEAAERIKLFYQKQCTREIANAERFLDEHYMRASVLCRLVNRSRNQKLLEEVPYVPYLDLAVVFYYMLEETFGTGSMLISRQHFDMWNIGEQELFRIAKANTDRFMPCRRYPMAEILQEMASKSEQIPGAEDLPMYVLTNEKRYFGAYGILYDRILEKAAREMGGDFYILPSSVHECILIPDAQAPQAEELEAMVREINSTQVLPEEVLSDHIYHYDSKNHHLIM